MRRAGRSSSLNASGPKAQCSAHVDKQLGKESPGDAASGVQEPIRPKPAAKPRRFEWDFQRGFRRLFGCAQQRRHSAPPPRRRRISGRNARLSAHGIASHVDPESGTAMAYPSPGQRPDRANHRSRGPAHWPRHRAEAWPLRAFGKRRWTGSPISARQDGGGRDTCALPGGLFSIDAFAVRTDLTDPAENIRESVAAADRGRVGQLGIILAGQCRASSSPAAALRASRDHGGFQWGPHVRHQHPRALSGGAGGSPALCKILLMAASSTSAPSAAPIPGPRTRTTARPRPHSTCSRRPWPRPGRRRSASTALPPE